MVDAPPPGQGVLFRFLNDQQGCLFWSLYVERSGAHAVLVSDRAFDVSDPEAECVPTELLLCADDFETFLYRFRLENDLWFVLSEGRRPTTAREKRYLEHYRSGG